MRTYRRKRLGSREGRQIRAVQMRARGMSLREIADELQVSHDTVWRDLKRAAARQVDYSASIIPLNRKSA